jgi:MFS transporter, UMF1 family
VHRKPLLLAFALLGATCAALFLLLPSSSPIWWSSALLAIFANVGFGASVVAMNAYLPALAKESPEVVAVREELDALREEMDDTLDSGDDPHESGEQSGLLETSQPVETTSKLLALTTCYESLLSQTTARISSQGIALGYGAGIILLLLTLIPVTLLHGSTWSLRLAIGLSGMWWAVGCIPVLIWLPGGGADPSGVGEEESARKSSTWVEIKNAWKKLARMLRWSEIKKLRNTFRYLSAWFLLSDGLPPPLSTSLHTLTPRQGSQP